MMTLEEMTKKVLGLIEELNPDSEQLTDDPDIALKKNDVINQVMFELARMKKIPDYVEMEVQEGDLIRFDDIKSISGNSVYQLSLVRGVDYELKASGTIIKALGSGTAEIDYYKYPAPITAETDGSYVFELSADALEIMPYGVAGHLLMSDVSANYGQVYLAEYKDMLQRLDPRYAMGFISFEGGVNI